MIAEAIAALKERGGSSRQAVAKYIKANFQVGESSDTHLKQALKRGVVTGLLVQVKGTGASGSFKLAKKVAEPKKPAAKKPTANKAAAKKPAAKKVKKPATKKAKSTTPKKASKPKPKTSMTKKTPKKAATKKPAAKKAAKKTPKKKTAPAKKTAKK